MVSTNIAMTPTLGGQIVRVYLENFMAYDSMEIRPGFHLNMIIGPNGTGKSTIVCAVLLGLGGKLKTLGRADQLSSYVKSSCDQSLIEIELYNPKGDNIVIRRMISSSNQSQFYINGKNSTAAQVAEVREKFNIQVDNLCTFLPQEKVQDFAKMNPQQLLEHTEKTIGTGELLQRHTALCTLKSELTEFENTRHVQGEQLLSEESKNERLLVKVQAIKEKQSLCEKVELLNQKVHWMKYHDIMKEKSEVEKDVNLADTNLNKKKKEIDIVQKELKAIDISSKAQQDALISAKNEESGKRAVVEDRLERLQHRLDRYADLDSIFKTKQAEEVRKKKDLTNCQATVEKLTNDLNTMDNSAESGLKREEQVITSELNKRHEEEVTLSNRMMSFDEEMKTVKQELRNVVASRRLLENRQNIRLEYLQKHEPNVHKAVLWLEQNQHLFHGKVYKPMLLELNVTDPKMARVVEATIPFQDLLAFTVTYGDDLNTLVNNLRVKMKLKINIVSSESANNTPFQPNISISRLGVFGFYAFVKDFISGPEPILQYLCRSYKIHNIPVGNASVQSNSEKIPNSIKKFFSEEHVFDVRVSAYSGAKSTTVKKLGTARFFTESTDVTKIASLQKREKELAKEVEKHQAVIMEMDGAKSKLHEEMQTLRRKRREIATRLEERQRVSTELERAQANYNRIKSTLRNPKELENELKTEKEAIETALTRMMADLKKAHKALEEAYEKKSKASLMLKASRIGIEAVQDRLIQAQEQARNAENAKRLAGDRLRVLETSSSKAREKAKELTAGKCPGDKGFRPYEMKFGALKNSIPELEDELEETQARAAFLDGGSAQVLKDYNKREEEIVRLRGLQGAIESKIENKLSEIELKKEEWLQPIKNLLETVDKSFGQYFASMGCAGEVCLLEPNDPNDFDSYGVKIRVTFRDGVPLQDLGRHFQSGGERAVATAIYMLSLQNLTSVPFRFVDEINQGMDPANERRITDLIIRVTTPVESSQYFFITPKLMPDFECPETMSVLCVYNGKAALTSSDWDINKFIDRAKGLEDDEESF